MFDKLTFGAFITASLLALTNFNAAGDNAYWNITRDPVSGYIYMDPISGSHEQTVIFLHGYSGDATNFEKIFADDLEAPTNTRIILPQAPMRWNPIWGGKYTHSWWTLTANPAILKDLNDYSPFFNQTEIMNTTDFFNSIIETERLKFSDGDSRRIFIGGMS